MVEDIIKLKVSLISGNYDPFEYDNKEIFAYADLKVK
jgi:hypothetical protein